MPAEPGRRPGTLAIHATAVAIGDSALLIRGASRAGKSRLALALIARTTRALPIRLIGDDRILLDRGADGLVARPHPRIAGFIERRGLGLVAMPWVAQAHVRGLVELGHPAGGHAEGTSLLARLPALRLERADDSARADRVLTWWAGLTAATAPHPSEKADAALLACAKD